MTTGKFGEVGDLGLNAILEFQADNAGGANPGDPEAEKEGFPYETNLPHIFSADGSFLGGLAEARRDDPPRGKHQRLLPALA